jgi:hypothetical protein
MDPDPRATGQANVPELLANPGVRFWGALVGTGVAAGIGAMVMMAVPRRCAAHRFRLQPRNVQWCRRSPQRCAAASCRLAVLAVGGVVAGVGWGVLRERAGGSGDDPTEAVAIELTNTIDPAMVAVLFAVVIVSRRLETRSIYSARIARPASHPKSSSTTRQRGAQPRGPGPGENPPGGD